MQKSKPSPALIEIAEILLRFEIEQIEHRKTAAAGTIRQDAPAATAQNQAALATRPGNRTTRRAAGQNREVQK